MPKPVVGFIINPKAGLGGRVGLKGSDGEKIQRRALELGAIPQAGHRAAAALKRLLPQRDDFRLLAWPGEMGVDVAESLGFAPKILGRIAPGRTTPEDTIKAAGWMAGLDASLIVFVGGDGTARNIYDGVPKDQPVLGVPAGVKMHSAVYAVNPERAGDLAADVIKGKIKAFRQGEVMDLDEEALRRDRIQVRLYGYLTVPHDRSRLQNLKLPSAPGETAAQASIAARVVRMMDDEHVYIIGPGTTTRAVLEKMNLQGTLIGVDVVRQGRLVGRDVNESQLLDIIRGREAKIVVTLIGGQGFLFGRGNQQIGPEVLKRIGLDHIIVTSVPEKIHALQGRPLLIDTGDRETDRLLTGYVDIITGYQDRILYRTAYG